MDQAIGRGTPDLPSAASLPSKVLHWRRHID